MICVKDVLNPSCISKAKEEYSNKYKTLIWSSYFNVHKKTAETMDDRYCHEKNIQKKQVTH